MLEQQEVYFKSDIFNKYFNMIKNERFNVRMTHPEEENRNNLQGDQEKKKEFIQGRENCLWSGDRTQQINWLEMTFWANQKDILAIPKTLRTAQQF